jgi:RND family efflux transporter MFP subunit
MERELPARVPPASSRNLGGRKSRRTALGFSAHIPHAQSQPREGLRTTVIQTALPSADTLRGHASHLRGGRGLRPTRSHCVRSELASHRVWWLVAVPALVVLGGAVGFGHRTILAKVAGIAGAGATASPRGPVAPTAIRAVGTVQASQQAAIRSRIAGVIAAVDVLEGQDVRAGDVLLRLDPTDARRALERARAAVAAQEAEVQQAERARTAALQAPGNDADTSAARVQASEDLSLAEARLKVAVADKRAAQDQLRYTKITAPFDGRITALKAQPGETVPSGTETNAGEALLVLANLDEAFVQLHLGAAQLSRVQVGQDAQIEAPGQRHAGKVVAREGTSVKVAVEDGGHQLARMTLGREVTVVFAPDSAVAPHLARSMDSQTDR